MTESQIFSHADWHMAAPGERSLQAKGHGQTLLSAAICSTYRLEMHAAQSCGKLINRIHHHLPLLVSLSSILQSLVGYELALRPQRLLQKPYTKIQVHRVRGRLPVIQLKTGS